MDRLGPAVAQIGMLPLLPYFFYSVMFCSSHSYVFVVVLVKAILHGGSVIANELRSMALLILIPLPLVMWFRVNVACSGNLIVVVSYFGGFNWLSQIW